MPDPTTPQEWDTPLPLGREPLWAVVEDCYDGAGHDVVVAICPSEQDARLIAAGLNVASKVRHRDAFGFGDFTVKSLEVVTAVEFASLTSEIPLRNQDQAQTLLYGVKV